MVATTEAPAAVAHFSLELNEEQLQLQQWVHEFAENVVRPAAHETVGAHHAVHRPGGRPGAEAAGAAVRGLKARMRTGPQKRPG